ncbi:CRP-like cAMP-binding protein [Litoreibacter ponti]|uniref:CRP-like cAMP-binding protein n=2 Tax=Litoreibacter ponti TaxID=1510457 RepID=A0A2T6BES6_9RHOB|nr:CRP-like cAMP-binding protein [Litoreibacter ponti]
MIMIMSQPWSELFADAPDRSLAPGETLFRREDPVHQMFWVRAGAITLRRTLADGGELELHRAGPGALVAEASLFAAQYHCDGISEASTEVAVLPRAALLGALEDGALAARALADAAREVQALRGRIEVMRLKTARARLDAYLELHGPPARGGWKGVADWIGVTPEALYRERARRRAAKT